MEKYGDLVFDKLGNLPERSDHPLTILFSVGGAGAQKEIGATILKKLCPMIRRGEIRVILSAGIRRWVMEYFLNCIKKLKLEDLMGNYINIIYEERIEDYFEKFNSALRKTDILWTKPSELSFYSGLGIPIIASPPIGSHEESNLRWLVKSGYGVPQGDLRYIDQWLFDWLDNGYLAEMAMEGFVEVEKLGVFRIRDIVFGL
jgi:UDP-N-acetylglucosamine:LPS N-acetylglucosamine transferase